VATNRTRAVSGLGGAIDRELEAKRLEQTWGPQVAQRYLNYQAEQDKRERRQGRAIRTQRWVSNTQHQPKRFNEQQAATIRMLLDAGQHYRQLGADWGVCQGTVSNVKRKRGAYRKDGI